MANIDIAHEFFYSDFDSSRNYNNISYSENLFYSYYTVIGTVVKDKSNDYVLLVSDDSMTPTTSKHIGYLISACPFDFVRVPMEYGNHYFSLDACIKRIVKNLDYYSNSKLSLKANRDRYIECFNQLQYINENIQDVDSSLIEQYKPLFDLLNNSDEVKQLKAKLKEKDRQDRIQAEKELQELLTTYDYFDLIRFVYDSYNSTIKFDDYTKTKAMQNKVKKALNPNNDLSFVWIENEYTVRTSKNIRMNMDIVKTGLKLWKHNKIKNGYKVDFYTVLEVRKDYIQIGCHKIPTENIQALYEKIYPSKSEPVKELQEVA